MRSSGESTGTNTESTSLLSESSSGRQLFVRPTIRGSELRYIATGYIGARLHTVIFTERRGKQRIISLRKSSRQEERDYAQT